MGTKRKPQGKPITALVAWDNGGDYDKDGHKNGTVLVLYSSGEVWGRMLSENQKRLRSLTPGKRQMTLPELKKDYGRDVDKMGEIWRIMVWRSEELKTKGRLQYEMASPDLVEELKK